MRNPDVKDEAGARAMLIERLARWGPSVVPSGGPTAPLFMGMKPDPDGAWVHYTKVIAALSSDAKDKRIAELEEERDKAVRLMNQWFDCHVAHRKALDALGAANSELFKRAHEDRQRAEAAEFQLRLSGTEDAGEPDREPKIVRDIDGIAESVASLVIGWVDGKGLHRLDWRPGLAEVIAMRLRRFSLPEMSTVATDRTEDAGVRALVKALEAKRRDAGSKNLTMYGFTYASGFNDALDEAIELARRT